MHFTPDIQPAEIVLIKPVGEPGPIEPQQQQQGQCAPGVLAEPGHSTILPNMFRCRNMEYVNLGSTGLKVSRLCLGAMTYGSKSWRNWILEEEESKPFIRRALELGINFFDTADIYSVGASEEILGNALREFGPSRDKLVIATKLFNPMGDDPNQKGLSRKHIRHAIDDSLKRLKTDYVDLYQIHRFDYNTPIAETLEALHDVVKAGKALYVGASSMFAWQFAQMLHTADRLGLRRFVTMQNHY